MEGRVSYTAVGFFVVVLVIAGISIFFWLTLRKHDMAYDQYVVYLHEEVSGLSVQSAVRYNGVPVGYVKSISLEPSNPQLVRVLLDIQVNTPINTSTVATLSSQGITGIDYVGLESEEVNAPPLIKKSGQEYPVIKSKPSLLVQLSKVMPQITTKITQLSNSISELFNKNNRDSIAATLKNIQDFTAALKDNTGRITASMKSLEVVLRHGRVVSKALPAMINQTKQTMASLKQTAVAIRQTAHSAQQTLQTGNAAISNISQQVVPSAQQALQQLTNLETNLESLSNDLKRNPSILVRGKEPTAPGPGEKR